MLRVDCGDAEDVLGAADVSGDLAKIDTRGPHDQMHEVDFAAAVGRQPIVLVFDPRPHRRSFWRV